MAFFNALLKRTKGLEILGWILGIVAVVGVFILLFFVSYIRSCDDDHGDILNPGHNESIQKNLSMLTNVSVSTEQLYSSTPSYKKKCHSLEQILTFVLVITLILGSTGYFIILSARGWWKSKLTYKRFNPSSFVGRIRKHQYVKPISHDGGSCPVKHLVEGTWKFEQRLGRDATGLTHAGIHVKHVFKVKNKGLLKKYNETKDEIRQTPASTIDVPELQVNPILTSNLVDINHLEHQDTPLIEPCSNLNPGEAYLFHGTKLECVTSILDEGLLLSRARAGLYGRAIYLAESSEKADQYTDYPENRRQTDLAMLIIRVNLGTIKCHKDNTPVTMSYEEDQPEYDTVVAGFDKRFREFLVFDEKKVYPEYVIIYDRTDSTD